MALGQWSFVAVVYDQHTETVTTYVDGAVATRGTAALGSGEQQTWVLLHLLKLLLVAQSSFASSYAFESHPSTRVADTSSKQPRFSSTAYPGRPSLRIGGNGGDGGTGLHALIDNVFVYDVALRWGSNTKTLEHQVCMVADCM